MCSTTTPPPKLAKWFEDRWNDRWCIDITEELVQVIEESWAREDVIPPYYIYIKMAYHLAQEARAGLSEFRIPRSFGDTLFDFQTPPSRSPPTTSNKRGGVLIGDVVGLGKTLMATALARVFEDAHSAGNTDHLPQEPGAHVGGLRATRYRLLGQGRSPISQRRTSCPTCAATARADRRKPQPPQPRGQDATGRSSEYIERTSSRCILLSRDALQQNLPRPRQPAPPLHRPTKTTSASAPSEYIRRELRRDRDSSAATSAPSIAGRLREERATPTTGANSCACSWSAAPAASSRTTTPRRIAQVRRRGSSRQTSAPCQAPKATGPPIPSLEDGTRSTSQRASRTLTFRIDDEDPDDQYARLYCRCGR